MISVLIPSYNHAHFIEETIKSIWSQPYKNIEIVVVDDASTDSSVDVITRLKSQSPIPLELIVNTKNSGPSATCNTAIQHSRGDLIAFIASDDLFMDDRFSQQLDIFNGDSSVQVVYGNGLVFKDDRTLGAVHGEDTCKLMSKTPKYILDFLYTHTSPLFTQTALIRRDLLLRIGGFDETELADDWILNTKIFCDLVYHGGTFGYVNFPLFLYRVHINNIHANFERQSKLKLNYIDKYTPIDLKGEAYANIGYSLAMKAIQTGFLKEAMKYFLLSQRCIPDYRKYPKFVGRIANALFVTTARRLFRQRIH